jgi:hypothetical protein
MSLQSQFLGHRSSGLELARFDLFDGLGHFFLGSSVDIVNVLDDPFKNIIVGFSRMQFQIVQFRVHRVRYLDRRCHDVFRMEIPLFIIYYNML